MPNKFIVLTFFFFQLFTIFFFLFFDRKDRLMNNYGERKKNKNNVPFKWIRKFNKLARDTKDDDYINEFLNTNEIFFRSL